METIENNMYAKTTREDSCLASIDQVMFMGCDPWQCDELYFKSQSIFQHRSKT